MSVRDGVVGFTFSSKDQCTVSSNICFVDFLQFSFEGESNEILNPRTCPVDSRCLQMYL